MQTASNLDMVLIAEARKPSITSVNHTGFLDEKKGAAYDVDSASSDGEQGTEPTDEELTTLRRVSGKIPWIMYSVAFVELCERLSYYGTTAVFVNFIQQPRPYNPATGQTSRSGSGHGYPKGQSGALGKGQQTSTGLTLFNSFWSYLTPLAGGIVADQYLGRYLTIQWSCAFAFIGHILLIISSLPTVLDHPDGAMAAFVLGLIIMGCGTGGFKSNISPLIGEQLKQKRMKVITLPSGERVIQDHTVTLSRVYLYFYMMINFGSLAGGIGMPYAEKYVGFWLAYLIPTVAYISCPVVLLLAKKNYTLSPPTGSVFFKAIRLWGFAMKNKWSINPVKTIQNMRAPNFWNDVKPSRLGNSAPAWMNFDDAWVDQLYRGISACKVFFWYPLYWLAYNQMTNNLTSQAATMQLDGVPNDVINNLNPLSLVIFIPIVDTFIYPGLRKAGINFTPIKRITWGFGLASCSMIAAVVTQYYIYKKIDPACGHYASDCDTVAPISVWVQAVPYVLIGFSEICASITGLEYAFTKAPENMRSVVTGMFHLQSAFSSAIGQAWNPLVSDPLLEWNYGSVAVLAAIGGVGFWFTFKDLDKEEDAMNLMSETAFKGIQPPLSEHDVEARRNSTL